ncbi:MAG: response regulator [bacterium]|nr:response regulator [bacterium]
MGNTEKRKILVVEDDEIMRGIEVKQLKSLDQVILEAEDGQQALLEIEKHKPDLILLDLLLPKVDGYGVLEAIRKHKDPAIAKSVVLVLSNLWSDKDILRAKALKVDAYFVKASTPIEDVIEKVTEILKDM